VAQIVLIAHLPLLRMVRQEDFPIGGGVLTRLPWEQFDGLVQGAFSDWRPKYEGTDPVFFWYQDDLDLPFVRPGNASSMDEMKLPQRAWDEMLPRIGHPMVKVFHDRLVDPVWAALALAAPAGVLPPPRSSVTFFVPAGEFHFEFGERTMNGVRVQGDADLELAHLPEAASAPLADDVLERARQFVGLAQFALGHASTGPALRQLLTCGDVTLSPSERLLLAVAAIEHLLLPDATSGSGEVFARRLARLVAPAADEAVRQSVHDLSRRLYRRRTAVLHSSDASDAETPLPPAAAEQLLAAALPPVTVALHAGATIEQVRQDLDGPGPATAAPMALPASEAPGQIPGYRLGPRKPWWSATFSSSGSMASPEGTIVSWSPLIGLGHDREAAVHPTLGVALTQVSADAVVGMEEKDIRRDFISKVRMGGSLAALAVLAPHEGVQVDEADVQPLTRRRDLAVAGLRLAGFDAFIDPDLLGWYVYAGTMRYRRETVLRQSTIMHIESAAPVPIGQDRQDAVWRLWTLLAAYEDRARDPEIDRVLDLYRRIHDRRFLPAVTRGVLAAVCVEAMLGRFRPTTATLRLERLVPALDGVPAAAARWFEHEARDFRNTLAHGQWAPAPIETAALWTTDHEPVAHLVAIAGAAVRTLLRVWVDVDPPVRARYGPARVLVRHLGRQLA